MSIKTIPNIEIALIRHPFLEKPRPSTLRPTPGPHTLYCTELSEQPSNCNPHAPTPQKPHKNGQNFEIRDDEENDPCFRKNLRENDSVSASNGKIRRLYPSFMKTITYMA
jgi:hypothetical protein